MKKSRYHDEEDYYSDDEHDEYRVRRFRQNRETPEDRKKRWERESYYDSDNDYDERR